MKVFQIGFNKCATLSLHSFFQKNGFNSVHWGGGNWNDVFHQNHIKGNLLCEGHDDIVFWSDLTYIQRHFETFAHQYPDSKFIYNIRPIADWIRSRNSHYSKNALDKYFIKKLNLDEHKIDVKQYWKSEWIIYETRVLEFFKGVHQDRLLIFNIMKDGGEEIQKFLPEMKFKDLTFPHKHKRHTVRK